MLSLRARRTALTCAVALVWISAIAFGAYTVLEHVKTTYSLYGRVREADTRLTNWRAESGAQPNEALIAAYEALKRDKREEAQLCANFYLNGNRRLDDRILRSFEADPIQLRINYGDWRRRMEARAGRPNFMDTYDWEAENGKPEPKNFRDIEKRTCIHDVLIRVLTHEGATEEIVSMKVGKPVTPGAPPRPDFSVARCRAFPVTIEFRARFAGLARVLNHMVSTKRAGDPPAAFMVIRQLSLAKPDNGMVNVDMKLDVLDFYEVE